MLQTFLFALPDGIVLVFYVLRPLFGQSLEKMIAQLDRIHFVEDRDILFLA